MANGTRKVIVLMIGQVSPMLLLDYGHLLIASSVIGLVLIADNYLGLKLRKQLLIASFRTFIQLSMIGLILVWIFAREAWYEVLSILTFMTVVASVSAKNRIKKPYKGLTLDTLIAVGVSGWGVAIIGVVWVMQANTWYQPQVMIPILGLILGNALTGVSLSINQLIENFHKEQNLIQMQLSLSASSWEASRPLVISAIHNGVTPTINGMMVVGLVSLPGMMTGQILAGADPQQAVLYQMITMFLIAGGSTFSCVIATLLVYRRFFNENQQFIIPK